MYSSVMDLARRVGQVFETQRVSLGAANKAAQHSPLVHIVKFESNFSSNLDMDFIHPEICDILINGRVVGKQEPEPNLLRVFCRDPGFAVPQIVDEIDIPQDVIDETLLVSLLTMQKQGKKAKGSGLDDLYKVPKGTNAATIDSLRAYSLSRALSADSRIPNRVSILVQATAKEVFLYIDWALAVGRLPMVSTNQSAALLEALNIDRSTIQPEFATPEFLEDQIMLQRNLKSSAKETAGKTPSGDMQTDDGKHDDDSDNEEATPAAKAVADFMRRKK